MRIIWTLVAVVVTVLIIVAVSFLRFNLSALEEPGHTETSIANWSRHFLIKRASRERVPAPPEDQKAGISEGSTLYGIDCSMCHGRDGRGQTDNGRWMYPRAADLTSMGVQAYSDRELFWIVKNGIRLSGMPGFGKVESDMHIWNLVEYLRTLPQPPKQRN